MLPRIVYYLGRSGRQCRLVLAVICLASLSMAQNLVQNPGFETGSFAPWVASSYGGDGGLRWSVTAGAGAHAGAHYAETGCSASGSQTCIAADPSAGAWLYQDLATAPGTQYTLTFYYAPGSSTGGGNAELQVLWGPSASPLTTGGAGTCTGSCVFDNTSIGSTTYTQHTVTLTATSTSMRLEFLGRQDLQLDFLDDVSVIPTAAPQPPQPPSSPVPSSLLLTLLGLATAGLYVGYRRMGASSAR